MNKKNIKINLKCDKGSIIILNTLFFLTISIAIIVGMSRPITTNYANSRLMRESKVLLISASSIGEEILYKINAGMTTQTHEEILLNNVYVYAEITQENDLKNITIEANKERLSYKLQIVLEKISSFDSVNENLESNDLWRVISWTRIY